MAFDRRSNQEQRRLDSEHRPTWRMASFRDRDGRCVVREGGEAEYWRGGVGEPMLPGDVPDGLRGVASALLAKTVLAPEIGEADAARLEALGYMD